ncbi:MAG: carbon-nitrogen hydrolase family protein [Deltaproteobacteria bacterium]|nr:carbon-nitrogen hydrolase family protein [Deltaproteobacteria bacterium]
MKFLAAAIQMLATSDKEANLREAEGWIRRAHAEGARLVVLPEVFNWRGRGRDTAANAEPVPGPTTERMGELAAECGLHLLAGSMLEAAGADGRAYNTSVLISPDAKIIARYRKIHLFDVDIEGEAPIRESEFRRPGEDVVVADTPMCPMGLSVCYDLRFPELYRRLTAAGARVVFVPSVFTVPTGRAHWEPLLRARAIENQVYIIAPDQTGSHPASMDAYGHSVIVDPWGKIIAQAGTEPGLVLAEIDLDYLEDVRRRLPALDHRRGFLTDHPLPLRRAGS